MIKIRLYSAGDYLDLNHKISNYFSLLPLPPMVIAVNTRFLQKDRLEGYGYFTREVFLRLAATHPEHEFYFLFDRPFDKEFIVASNIHPVVIPPAARHPILWKYWFDIKVPLALKKIKAGVFISPDGFCSLTTSVPQCLVIHDLGFLHYPQGYHKSHLLFYKNYTPKFLKKAKSVVTVSQFSKNDLIRHYKISPDKVKVVYSAVKDIFKPLIPEIREEIKETYTTGKEYFIYVGSIHPRKNLLNLLKGFSIFKKRLRSNMKLVLAGRMGWKNNTFQKQLKTYKYREDVIITEYIEEEDLARLVGSAYALIYPSFFEGFGVPVLEAMKCGIPALTSEKTAMQEIAGEAGLYFNPHDHTDIGEKLMLIYKDENLRSRLIQKGHEIASAYSWQHTADLLWEAIENFKVNV